MADALGGEDPASDGVDIAFGGETDFALGAAGAEDGFGEAENGAFHAGGDVVDLALGAGGETGQEGGANHVIDVREVPGLLAVAEDSQGIPFESSVHKTGDDAAVRV